MTGANTSSSGVSQVGHEERPDVDYVQALSRPGRTARDLLMRHNKRRNFV